MFKKIVHIALPYLVILGLAAMLIGLPFSKPVLSIGQFILVGVWLLEFDFSTKWKNLKSNKLVWACVSFYVLHVVGLIWTSDFKYALDDLRVKLPLLALPIIFASLKNKPSTTTLQYLFGLFVLGILVYTGIGTLNYFVIHPNLQGNPRQLSPFTSHIRIGLMICLSIVFLLFHAKHVIETKSSKGILILGSYLIIILWFIKYIMMMEALTALVILGTLMLLYLLYSLNTKQANLARGFLAIVLSGLGYLGYVIQKEYKQTNMVSSNDYNKKKLESNNHAKYQQSNLNLTENGNLVYINIAFDELVKEWNKKAFEKIEVSNPRHNEIYHTLVRYLSSKGLGKDSIGVSKLSIDDCNNIYAGYSNYLYTNKNSLNNRLHELCYEVSIYNKTKSTNGHSMTQRIEYGLTAIDIIKQNPILGVGTGDLDQAYNLQYWINNTQLSKEWQLRSHNQYLASMVAFGITGILFLLFSILYPLTDATNRNMLYLMFLGITLLSFLNEDTLESQAGVSFYALFNCILIFFYHKDHERKTI